MFEQLREHAWRLAAAGVLLAVTVVLVVLFGRPPPSPTVGVLVTVEQWTQGTAGQMTVVDVPESLSGLLVTPDGLGNSVAAFDIPANTLITAAMLRPPLADDSAELGFTRVRLVANVSLWPAPGPQPGDVAVFGRAAGGCALLETEVLSVEEEGGGLVVAVPPEAVSLAAGGDLSAWPPAAGGWPLCAAAPSAADDRPPPTPLPPGKTAVRLAADVSLWPAPGPQPGDVAVFGRAAGGCALLQTEVLSAASGGGGLAAGAASFAGGLAGGAAAGEMDLAEMSALAAAGGGLSSGGGPQGGLVVAVGPDELRELGEGSLSAWPPPSGEEWTPCRPPDTDEANTLMRFQVDSKLWPRRGGPQPGDQLALGPTAACALVTAEAVYAAPGEVVLEVDPNLARRLSGESSMLVWKTPAGGGWPAC